jgi:hypothetical protein
MTKPHTIDFVYGGTAIVEDCTQHIYYVTKQLPNEPPVIVQHFAFDEKQSVAVVERAKHLFVIFDAGYDLFDAPFNEFKQDLVAAVFSRMLYNNLDTN